MNKAIDGRMDNALEALHHLRWLVDDRGYRCRRAQDIWRNDIAYVSRIINSGTLQEADAISVAHHVTKIKNQQRSRDPFAFLRYRHIREVKAHTTTA